MTSSSQAPSAENQAPIRQASPAVSRLTEPNLPPSYEPGQFCHPATASPTTANPHEGKAGQAELTSDEIWFATTQDQVPFGPMSLSALNQWVLDQHRTAQTLRIWRPGWTNWRTLEDFESTEALSELSTSLASKVIEIQTTTANVVRTTAKRKTRRVAYMLLAACITALIPLLYVIAVGH